jgi:hypothetical protein
MKPDLRISIKDYSRGNPSSLRYDAAHPPHSKFRLLERWLHRFQALQPERAR